MNNLFLAIGPDSFQLSETVEQYKKASLKKYGEFSVEYFSLTENEISTVESSLSAPSFFGGEEKRVIFIEGFPQSASSKFSDSKKQELESFLQRLISLPKDVVVFCINSEPDKRTKIFKTLQKNASKVFEHPLWDPKKDGKKIEEWIQKRALQYQSNIDSSSASFLRSYVGSDLQTLDIELKKLSTLRISDTIQNKDITEICIPSAESADFAFSNAVSSGKVEKILSELEVLSKEFDSALVWNRDVLSTVRTLLKSKLAMESPEEKSGIHPFVLRNVKKVLSSFSYQEIQSLHKACGQIDTMTKNGKLTLSGESSNFLITLEILLYRFFQK